MTGHPRKGTEGYGLIRASSVSRVVAGGGVFVYLMIVFELDSSLS